MTIRASGDVGIGTASPSDKLHVSAGAIRLDNFYQLRWNGTGTGIYGHSTQGLNFFTGSGTTRLKIEDAGDVGIGTTSPSSFNSRGRNLVVNSDGDTGITISANSTSSSTLLFADAFALQTRLLVQEVQQHIGESLNMIIQTIQWLLAHQLLKKCVLLPQAT